MASSKKLAEIRNTLQAVQIELERRGGTSSPKIITVFRERHASLIRGASRDLEDVALLRLLNQASTRKRSVSTQVQPDLFKDHPGIPISITIPGTSDAHGNRRRQLFTKSSFHDVNVWLNDDSARPTKRKLRHPGVATLLAEIRPFAASDEALIEDAVKAWEKAKKSG